MKNNKAELAAIHIVLIVFVLIFLFSFGMDFLKSTWAKQKASTVLHNVSNIIGKQGGVLPEQPEGGNWEKGFHYTTTSEMSSYLNSEFNNKAFFSDWDLTMNGISLKGNSSGGVYDRGEDIELILTLTYRDKNLDRTKNRKNPDGLKKFVIKNKVASEVFIRNGNTIY